MRLKVQMLNYLLNIKRYPPSLDTYNLWAHEQGTNAVELLSVVLRLIPHYKLTNLVNQMCSSKKLTLGYKLTTSRSHDFHVSTTKSLTTQVLSRFSIN